MARHGFSLIELSIVLVILGLLVGGILAGQSLIHAAELRTLSADTNKYQQAALTFRDKYMGMPGDITNAASFWPAGGINGGGNGYINSGGEQYQAMYQLAMAGLIEGQYTGVAASPVSFVEGVNYPGSRYGGGVGFVLGYNSAGGNDKLSVGGNKVSFGRPAPSPSGNPWQGALIPEDMWNIDKKIDDGVASEGRFIGISGQGYRGAGVTTCHTPGYVEQTGSFDYTMDSTVTACHGNLFFN